MNEREERLLELFRKLSTDDQDEALDYLEWLTESVDERRTVGHPFEDIIPKRT